MRHFWFKGLGFIFLFAVFSIGANAQIGWTATAKSTASGDLNTVFFDSAKRGWIAGDNGYLAWTNDAGKSWTQLKINTTEAISDIYFRGAEKGYAIAGEKVFSSVDGGKTWREEKILLSSEVTEGRAELASLRFANKKNGWVVGFVNKNDVVMNSLVLHSSDGGAIWRRVQVPVKTELIHLDFADDTNGWIVGTGGVILRTTDGGENWRVQKSNTTEDIFHINFTDKNNGWAVGAKGLILRTVNGGETWQKITSNVTKTLLSVEFANDKTGWIVGRGGNILRTTDGGLTWIKQETNTTENFYALFVDKKMNWTVGSKGTILRYER